MGQYYRPCLLNPNYKKNKKKVLENTLSPYAFGTCAKLTEHSWIGNCLVASAMIMLLDNKTNPFVWAGDYADTIKGRTDDMNVYDFTRNGVDTKCSDQYRAENGEMTWEIAKEMDWYIINHTKKEYVKVPKYRERVWQPHPLPLLTAESNGKGGGDYPTNGLNADKVGMWKYDIIGTAPHKSDVPKGYKRINIKFIAYI